MRVLALRAFYIKGERISKGASIDVSADVAIDLVYSGKARSEDPEFNARYSATGGVWMKPDALSMPTAPNWSDSWRP